MASTTDGAIDEGSHVATLLHHWLKSYTGTPPLTKDEMTKTCDEYKVKCTSSCCGLAAHYIGYFGYKPEIFAIIPKRWQQFQTNHRLPSEQEALQWVQAKSSISAIRPAVTKQYPFLAQKATDGALAWAHVLGTAAGKSLWSGPELMEAKAATSANGGLSAQSTSSTTSAVSRDTKTTSTSSIASETTQADVDIDALRVEALSLYNENKDLVESEPLIALMIGATHDILGLPLPPLSMGQVTVEIQDESKSAQKVAAVTVAEPIKQPVQQPPAKMETKSKSSELDNNLKQAIDKIEELQRRLQNLQIQPTAAAASRVLAWPGTRQSSTRYTPR